jgi:hypothetical protein
MESREEVPTVYKVDLGDGFIVQVDSIDELQELYRHFPRRNAALQGSIAFPNPASAESSSELVSLNSAIPKKAPRGARYVPTEVKIRSVSTEEALLKLYKGLDNATHRDALRFLAAKGERGASVEDLKEALNLPEKYKMGGLTAAIRRRTPAYGLQAEDVLIVEYRGIVANVRILDYRLGPGMLQMMNSHGFAMKLKAGKPFKEEE